VANGGLLALLAWTMAQLSPFVPALGPGVVRRNLVGIFRVIDDPARFDLAVAIVYGANILGLGMLAVTLVRRDRRVLRLFVLAVTAILLLKIFVAGRALSIEAIVGLLAAAILLSALQRAAGRTAAWIGILAIGAGFCISELVPAGGPLHPFNWIPFAGEIRRNFDGFATILGSVWPFIAIGYLANTLTAPAWRRHALVGGAVLVAILTGELEWHQTSVAGRYGDITSVLLALVGWLIPWHWTSVQTPSR
jgi:hypothetical protein